MTLLACGETDVTRVESESGSRVSNEEQSGPALRPVVSSGAAPVTPRVQSPANVDEASMGGDAAPAPQLWLPDAGSATADAGAQLDPACERGELRCEGSLIARCNARGSDFELLRDCREARQCEAAVTRCSLGACTQAEVGCSLPELLPASEGVHGVAVGRQLTCAVITGGALRCWGRNHQGQLGYGRLGSIGDSELPVSAGNVDVGGVVSQVAAGLSHTCALLSNGEVSCWGQAGSGGRLGEGDYLRRRHFAALAGLTENVGDDETPASVGRVPLGGPAIQVAAGNNFTCALLSNGDVRCWGVGLNGALGQGATDNIGDDETPASMPPLDLGGPAAFIASGFRHSCAIMRTGEVRCWGWGRDGVLGYGGVEDIGDDEAAGAAGAVRLRERAVHLSASQTHSCAVLLSGALQCWGDDLSRQLGGGQSGAALPVLDLGARVLQVAAGNEYTCALLEGGAVRCWGVGLQGQLGAGDRRYRTFATAEPSVELGAPATQLEAHREHTCALLATRELICWGAGYEGNLGYGNTEDVGDDETPAAVGVVPVLRSPPPPDLPEPEPPPTAPEPVPLPSPEPDAGSSAWSPDAGPGDVGVPGTAGPERIESVVLGDQHTCILTVTGRVRCWGDNEYGQLGYGHTRDLGLDETPATAGDVDVGGSVRQLAAGAEHTCALLEDGSVRCWGHADNGQLGLGNTSNIGDDERPASVPAIDLGGPALQIAASGGSFTCALLTNGEVRCWGSGTAGQLGQGPLVSTANRNIGDDETPASFAPLELGGPSARLAVGQNHACALSSSGDVRCWGRGSAGRLGYGHTRSIGDDETPASAGIVLLGGPVVDLSAGNTHSCAILQGGALRCWGRNADEQLGHPTEAPFGFSIGDDETPDTALALDLGQPVIRVAAGDSHTCALLSDGAVRCWGANRLGQLGSASGDTRIPLSSTLPSLALGMAAIDVAAGEAHSCAVVSTGELSCWGDVSDGKLGYGQGAANARVGDDETPGSMGAVPVFRL